jgi:hypothetical protein
MFSRSVASKGGSLPASRLVAGLGADLADVEQGDPAAAEADEAPIGEVAENLGGGLPAGAGQGGDLFVGSRQLAHAGYPQAQAAG